MKKTKDFIFKDIHLNKLIFMLTICISLYLIIDLQDKEILLISCYSGVFVIQQNTKNILSDSVKRFIGCLVAGIISLLFFWIGNYFTILNSELLLLCIPLIIFISIKLVGGFTTNKVGSLSICLTTINMLVIVGKPMESYYLIERLISTIVGSSIAITVNIIFHSLKKYKTELK